MKTVCFITSTMEEESRVALAPDSLSRIRNPDYVLIQKRYASHLGDGFQDSDYERYGARVVETEDIRKYSDVVITPKRSMKDAIHFRKGMTFGGWLYVSQTRWLAENLLANNMSGFAFEKLYDENGYVFKKNREITGRVGIKQALSEYDRKVSSERFRRVAILGKGNVGKYAIETLIDEGYEPDVFTSSNVGDFFGAVDEYDMIVNCVKWDHSKGKFLTAEHIKQMKDGCLIADISSEGIEGSIPQPLHDPLYRSGHIYIYNNEHIPTLVPAESSTANSIDFEKYIDMLVEGRHDRTLDHAFVVKEGEIVDKRIFTLLDTEPEGI